MGVSEIRGILLGVLIITESYCLGVHTGSLVFGNSRMGLGGGARAGSGFQGFLRLWPEAEAIADRGGY